MINNYKISDNNKKTNLLYISRGLFIGGAELVIANLCKNINKDIFSVNVCYLEHNGPIGYELIKNNYSVFKLPKYKLIKSDYLSLLKLSSIVKKMNIDIIHSHDTASLVESALCKIITPSVKHIHTFHYGNYPYLPNNNLILERLTWRIPNKLVAVGKNQKKAISKALKIPNDKIMMVWNGIEECEACVDVQYIKRFTCLKKVIIGSISTFIEQKGLTYLLDVAFLLKERKHKFVFLIVGDGPLRNELESKSRKLRLEDTVFFLGWIENAASRILPIFDIFYQSSIWEAMSIVLLEAMVAGKPIVATNVGDNEFVIDDGKNGFLIEPKNINSMTIALEKLILNKELRNEFGKLAKKKIIQLFNINSMTKAYEDIYKKLMIK